MAPGSGYLSLVLNQSWSNDGYERLEYEDSIRLVKLKPSCNDDDPVECNLFNSRLSEKPDYLALSYEWGQPDDENDPFILVNGCHLQIRRNLYEALRAIRASVDWSGEKPLWIDAISINQGKSHGEKPHQVRMMGQIFRNAWAVIAWLGVARDSSDMAMDFFSRYIQDWRVRSGPDPQSMGFYPSDDERNAINSLLNRSYWRRVWIVQEIQLAIRLTVRCGTKLIDAWELYEALCYLIVSWPDTDEIPEHFTYHEIYHYRRMDRSIEENERQELALCMARNFRKSLLASVPFQHFAARTFRGYQNLSLLVRICVEGQFEATEPRDYIFALTAVADDPWISHIHVDYEKSVELVYQEALPVIRETLKREEWLSTSPDNTIAKKLAERMGVSYDYDRDVVNVDGAGRLARLIRDRDDLDSMEWITKARKMGMMI